MVSRDLLLEASSFVLPMPVAEGLPGGVRYPTEFRAEYEAAQGDYRFVFSGFKPIRPAQVGQTSGEWGTQWQTS
jgi:hypothetical protein